MGIDPTTHDNNNNKQQQLPRSPSSSSSRDAAEDAARKADEFMANMERKKMTTSTTASLSYTGLSHTKVPEMDYGGASGGYGPPPVTIDEPYDRARAAAEEAKADK